MRTHVSNVHYVCVQEDYEKQDHPEYQLRRSSAALAAEELSRLHIAAAVFGAAAAEQGAGSPTAHLRGGSGGSGRLPPALAAAAAAAHREEAARVKLALLQDDAYVRSLHTARDCLRRVAGPNVSPTPPEVEQLDGVHVRSCGLLEPVVLLGAELDVAAQEALLAAMSVVRCEAQSVRCGHVHSLSICVGTEPGRQLIRACRCSLGIRSTICHWLEHGADCAVCLGLMFFFWQVAPVHSVHERL